MDLGQQFFFFQAPLTQAAGLKQSQKWFWTLQVIRQSMKQNPSSPQYADEVARLRASESDSDAELLVCRSLLR